MHDYKVTRHDNMPAKKTVKAVRKTAPKKVVRKSPFAKAVTAPVVEVPVKTAAHGRTWGGIVEAVMKKPRTWADWTARQLDENKLK